MLKMSCSSYPYFLISSWICFLSFPTVSAFDKPASPCCLISFKPFLSLNCPSQPLLNFNLSSLGILTKSANLVYFWRRTSPVSEIPSLIAFETQRLIISETSGCSVCRARLVFWSFWWTFSFHCLCHLTSSLSQLKISGCLSLRFG
jgi:hypothetical protein